MYSVNWTEFAQTKLDEIFQYYETKASFDLAINIISGIKNSTEILYTNPLVGQKELFLQNRDFEYRYLISKNYKIIYYLDETIVFITDIFDTRQDPSKLIFNQLNEEEVEYDIDKLSTEVNQN